MKKGQWFWRRKSGNFSVIQLFVSVPEINTLQKKAQLLARNLCCLRLICRPGELVLLQALQPQAETVLVPVDDFQDPSVLVAEKKQVSFKWIHVKILGDEHRKPVDLLSHVEIVARPSSE
jgi:hypothetical protein